MQNYDRLRKILTKYGEDVTAEMIAILNSSGAKNLQNNISQELIEDLEFVGLVIKMPSYAVWADSGRGTGVMPPLNNIKEWAKDRGIPEAAAYPIARKIALVGTKASAKNFLKIFYERFPNIKQEVKEAVTADYIETFRAAINRG